MGSPEVGSSVAASYAADVVRLEGGAEGLALDLSGSPPPVAGVGPDQNAFDRGMHTVRFRIEGERSAELNSGRGQKGGGRDTSGLGPALRKY